MNKTMKWFAVAIGALFFVLLFTFSYPQDKFASGSDMETKISLEFKNGALDAMSLYYGKPKPEILVIRESVPVDEIPVVLFIASKVNVAPDVIVSLRLDGKSWMAIVSLYHLSPAVFYVPVTTVVTGPPFGRAYGYYKNKPKSKWNTIVMSDADVINLVNLRFVSQYYKVPPEKVITLRQKQKETSYVFVHQVMTGEKSKKKNKHNKATGFESKNDEGKIVKGNGKDKGNKANKGKGKGKKGDD